LYITGDPTEDKVYYDLFLAPLFSKYFVYTKPKSFPYWGVYGLSSYRKEVINKALKLGFQSGKKALVAELPKYIFDSKNTEIIKGVLRGVFDTDGSFWCEKSRSKTSTAWKRKYHSHPELRITSCSKKLLQQLKILLDRLNIKSQIKQKTTAGRKYNRNCNDCFALQIRKISEIIKWFEVIGTNNPRHKTKCDIWKKFGFLPPYTKIDERLKILKGEIEPGKYYK